MLVVWLPLRASSPETNRTTAGANETRPLPKVTSTVVGRLLRNVTVRCPTDRRVVGHPASVSLGHGVPVLRDGRFEGDEERNAVGLRSPASRARDDPEEAGEDDDAEKAQIRAQSPQARILPAKTGKFQEVRFVE